MGRLVAIIVAFMTAFVGSATAQSVEVRFLHGEPNEATSKPVSNGENKVVVRTYKLAKSTDCMRLTIPKEHIADDVWAVEVIPSFMKATSVQMRSTSDRIWVEKRTVVCSFTACKVSRISFRPIGSRAEVGSSQINSLGLFNRA